LNRVAGPAGDSGDRRPVVLLANPQNGRGSSAGRSPYPNLGLLTLATALEAAVDPDAAVVWYYDGALLGDDGLATLIAKHGHRIEVLGLSAYTYNFEQCIRHARALKATSPSARVAMGNDHFSARHAQILARNADVVDCGFVGNDVVESFARWVRDVLAKREMPVTSYPGLTVLRDGQIHRQAEQPQEYARLPLVDYGLQDSYTSHRASYRAEQQELYSYLRDSGREIGLVDFARGCLKFAGPRTSSGTPLSACEFCGIIPGAKAIASVSSTRAWQTIGNAFDQGYRYLFATADELPWTFWPLLRSMAATKPDWYLDLHLDDRPRLMCYARADVFKADFAQRIDLAIQDLLIDHFVVGLDGLTEDSLRSMNKPIGSGRAGESSMLEENFRACSEIHRRGAKLTAGVVLTHIGSTPDLLEAGFKTLTGLLGRYRSAFVELDFELFCPIPGSLAYDYFQVPETGVRRARELGVDLRESALMAKSKRYADADFIDPEEMIDDFIEVFCPTIDRPMANAYLDRIRNAVEDLGLVYECGSL
jgi:hypothetical protein